MTNRTRRACTSYERLTPERIQVFRSQYKEKGPDECWIWKGVMDHGYGVQALGHSNETKQQYRVKAHRAAWMIANGPIPPGLFICHRCDVRACVNPAHLFAGTLTDNNRDRNKKGRSARGEMNASAKLTAARVAEIRRLRASGATYAAIADMFGVHPATALRACTGENWKHLQMGKEAA